MEKKTIGQFIAILRKANGLTQKELAEKLNVTDKTVSRWERDESLPDLTLIPVLAEIFGVTSDEILRGERASGETVNKEYVARQTEKTKKHLLNSVRTKFNIRSAAGIAVAIVGLLSAMLCNLGFLRAYLGFFVACFFYVGAVTIQIISLILAFASLKNTEFEFDEANMLKRSIFSACCKALSIDLILFAFTLPLIAEVGDVHWGLTVAGWFPKGLLFAVICAIICFVLCYAAKLVAANKKIYEIDENEKKSSISKAIFVGKRAVVLCIILLVTFVFQYSVANLQTSIVKTFGTCVEFTDIDEFKKYIETETDWERGYFDYHGNPIVNITPPEDLIEDKGSDYEDIDEKNYVKGVIYNKYGTEVLLSYKHKNLAVVKIFTEWDGENIVIKTYTNSSWNSGHAVFELFMYLFVAAYIAEIAVFVILGVKKYKKTNFNK